MPTSPLKIAFYGDDFAGSTDAMEALCLAGLKTVLFLETPTVEALAAYPGIQAVGVAGKTRTLSPEAMEKELGSAFEGLKTLGAPLLHYKISSTFESSTKIGSIGKACDVGRTVLGSSFVPLVVAAPHLGRYCVFGNLFAKSSLEGEVFRLDRHPVMSVHPATPMDEADLARHLAKQTTQSIALFDFLKLQGAEAQVDLRFEELLAGEPDIVLFDGLLETHMARIGKILWSRAEKEGPLYAVGSSGVEYALAAHWRQAQVQAPQPAFAGVQAADKIIVVSGSFSPVTARQIQGAFSKGFAGVSLEPLKILSLDEAEIEKAVVQGLKILESKKSVILHTALGPQDARVKASAQGVREAGPEKLAMALGKILKALAERSGVKRAAVVGGDTAGFVAKELGFKTLEMAAAIQPGSPLCKAGIPGSPLDGLEILFKEGNTGKDDVFEKILAGKA